MLEKFESLDARGHGEGVAAQGARLIHRASWSHHLHDFPAAAVGTNGKTAADHLAHGCEVGGDAEMGLGSAVADAESGHHFVEDQEGAVLLGDLPKTFQESGLGGDEASVTHDRFENHPGDCVGIFREELLDGFKVVVGSRECVGGGASGHAGGVGQSEGGDT